MTYSIGHGLGLRGVTSVSITTVEIKTATGDFFFFTHFKFDAFLLSIFFLLPVGEIKKFNT